MIHVGLITYSIDIAPLVNKAGGPDISWHLFTHSANQAVHEGIRSLFLHHNISLSDHRTNRGLARSWNDFLVDAQAAKADVMLIINDDVLASHDDLLKLAQGCLDHPEAGIVTAWGFNERMGDVRDNGYSFFGLNRIAIEKVGYFDENFYPIYFEDSDYTRRLALAGIPFHSCTETNIFHKGSASIGTVAELNRQNNHTFQANNAYFVRKWGGQPGNEIFPNPFNSPQFDLKIAAEQRQDPYPGYGRTDQDIVKI